MAIPAVCLFLVGGACVVQGASMPDDSHLRDDLRLFVTNLWPLVGGLAVLAAGWGVLWSLTNRLWLGAMVALPVSVALALANAAKLAMLNVPILPTDLYRIGDLATIYDRSFESFGGAGKFAVLALPAAAALLGLLFLPRAPMRWPMRLGLGLIGAAFFASLFGARTSPFAHMPQTYPKYNWDIRRTYDENGFAACLAMHCRFLSVQPPEGYSADAIRKIVRALPPASQPAGDLRPNVIVILSESFWDATRFPGVEFGTDPVPTFHQLQREFGSLDVVSPTFGGLTCNAEFEVLTGFNMAFFPQSMEAYVDYVRRPVPSLAWMLRGRGYQTITLHALGGVHNDAQVQPLLGFERCVTGAEWSHRDTVGPWIADDAATSEIIERTGQLRPPYFVCVNTIEGHTPYDNEKYGPSGGDIRFTKPLSGEARDIVRNYSRGLHNADLALKRLIDHFRDAKDPVLIVFYGDHLPILGDDLKVYRETGMCFEGQDSRSLPMRRMQAVIWNNYGRRLSPPSGLISMNQMLPILLDLTDTPQPAHVRLLGQIARRWPVVGTSGCVDDSGKTAPLDTLDGDVLLRNWRLMQYDLLFGNQQFLKNPER